MAIGSSAICYPIKSDPSPVDASLDQIWDFLTPLNRVLQVLFKAYFILFRPHSGLAHLVTQVFGLWQRGGGGGGGLLEVFKVWAAPSGWNQNKTKKILIINVKPYALWGDRYVNTIVKKKLNRSRNWDAQYFWGSQSFSFFFWTATRSCLLGGILELWELTQWAGFNQTATISFSVSLSLRGFWSDAISPAHKS